MLRSLNEMLSYELKTLEDQKGKIADFYFDDKNWRIRYVSAKQDPWAGGQKVLVPSRHFLEKPDWASQRFPVNLSFDQMITHQSPETCIHALEKDHAIRDQAKTVDQIIDQMDDRDDPRFRSFKKIKGYRIQTVQKEMGRVADFIVDDHFWAIRFLVVDTKHLLTNQKVLVVPLWVNHIQWADHKIDLHITEEELSESPAYHPDAPINTEKEEIVFDYYGRPKGKAAS